MVGAGRSEVARAIVGIDAKNSGEVLLEGKALNIQKPIDAINAGIVLIPENRKEEGLVLENSVRFNTTLAVLKQFIKGVIWNRKKEESIVDSHIKSLNIRTPHQEQLILNLSGGNQQKVVIAKWLATEPKVLIMDEPTRGVDVGAKAEIYTIMNSLAKQGISIIMISSDLPEIINMSDRVMVMREGKLAGILEKDEIGQEQIMRFAV
jgi:ribose transport system ATP-binding protein/inositol transport system ATP-binding protein